MAESIEQLLRRVEDRQPDAVAELVRRHGPAALRLARAYLNDPALAEDAVQEALLSALGRLSTLRSPAAFGAWLRQIVRTEAGRIRRRRPGESTGTPPDLADAAPGPGERAEDRETREQVRDAVAKLPPAGRETVELYYFEGRRIPEVARALGVPEGTVKRRLHDARRRLADILLGGPGAVAGRTKEER